MKHRFVLWAVRGILSALVLLAPASLAQAPEVEPELLWHRDCPGTVDIVPSSVKGRLSVVCFGNLREPDEGTQTR